MKKIISLSALFSVLFSLSTHGTTYWWKPQLGSTSFTTASNWVTGLTCGTTLAQSAPGSSDDINFTSCGTGNCHIDGNITVNSITIASSYTGTVSINTGKTFTFKSGSFKGGTFTATDGAVTCNKDITIDGTSFTSTSSDFKVNGDFTYKTGGFTHNSGKVIFQHGTQAGRRTISSTSNLVTVSFYKVEFASPDSDTEFSVSNITMEVNNQLKISGSHQVFLNTSTSSVIKAKGDILSINSSSVGGGTATIEITGTANQALNDNSGSNPSGKLPNIKINKTLGTLTLQGNIGMGGSTKWEYTAGTVDAGTSKVMCYYSNTLKNSSAGTMSFYDLEIMGLGDQDIIDGTVQVTHTFSTSYKGLCVINAAIGGGRLELQGDMHWYNQNATSFGNATFKFTGSNSQTVKDSIEPVLYTMEINKSNNSVTLQGPVSVSNNLNLANKNIVTDATNLITLKAGATVSNGSSSSFVSGPMKKVGNSAFTFPVGKSTSYNPIKITAPSSSSDAFTAEFFNSANATTTKDTSLTYLSTCEYWTLTRNTGSSNVKVSLTWNQYTCDVYALSTLRIAYLNSGTWQKVVATPDAGSTRVTGTITSNSSVSSFGSFTMGRKIGTDTLGYITEIENDFRNDYQILAKSLVNLINNDTFIHIFVDEANVKPLGECGVTLKSLVNLCLDNDFDLQEHMAQNLINNHGSSYEIYRLAQINDSLIYDDFIFYPMIQMPPLDTAFFDQDGWDHYSSCALTTPQFCNKDSIPIFWMSGNAGQSGLIRSDNIMGSTTWALDCTHNLDNYWYTMTYPQSPCRCEIDLSQSNHYICVQGCANNYWMECGYTNNNGACEACCFCIIVVAPVHSDCTTLIDSVYHKQGLKIADNEEKLSIYPNPSSDILQIRVPSDVTNFYLKISNLSGVSLYNASITNIRNAITVNINSIPDGLYLVTVLYNGKSIVKKIVVQHS